MRFFFYLQGRNFQPMMKIYIQYKIIAILRRKKWYKCYLYRHQRQVLISIMMVPSSWLQDHSHLWYCDGIQSRITSSQCRITSGSLHRGCQSASTDEEDHPLNPLTMRNKGHFHVGLSNVRQFSLQFEPILERFSNRVLATLRFKTAIQSDVEPIFSIFLQGFVNFGTSLQRLFLLFTLTDFHLIFVDVGSFFPSNAGFGHSFHPIELYTWNYGHQKPEFIIDFPKNWLK